MSEFQLIDQNVLRAAFSSAMSKMYRDEVPAYGTLMDLVAEVNVKRLAKDTSLANSLLATDGLNRISDERHGAIRVGTEAELKMIRRVFALLGMYPVGYYDLSVAGIPVHSTAFRPLGQEALSHNPFRVFTSLLRLDLINDNNLQIQAENVLAKRHIFSGAAVKLIEKAENEGGVSIPDSEHFIREILKTFKWHTQANVTHELYNKLHDAHRLIADIVSFKGPHINHLTPRTLDIDQVQDLMPSRSINPKAVIEGPPKRKCPILLRQTSFKAIEEDVDFTDVKNGKHTARFGEIEQRGAALTPKGRALYDRLLNKTRDKCTPAADGSNAQDYINTLNQVFVEFPDDWKTLHTEKLAYFSYQATKKDLAKADTNLSFDELIEAGVIRFDPIIYEDFLPVSAAGIFQSNLGDKEAANIAQNSNQDLFENQLGAKVLDEFEHYAKIEAASKKACLEQLQF
ncbi:VOC family protein [Lentilitoribacter sp. EG35]|uniref:2-oxoadipate dioxygenase/decarboxylase HglS n=1 Tax=Lentilitoribacter sp. EG35 TaxID=3234192 RepID=UPI00346019B6